MTDPNNPPFQLFDELEAAMTKLGSLYLGPNWRGYYLVLSCADDADVLARYRFHTLVAALRAQDYREGQDAEDFDAAFQVDALRNWVGAPTQLILVPHEQHAVLVFAGEYLANELDPLTVLDSDAYWDFQVAAAQAVWEDLSTGERRNLSARLLDGHRYAKWASAYAHDNYHELVDELLTD